MAAFLFYYWIIGLIVTIVWIQQLKKLRHLLNTDEEAERYFQAVTGYTDESFRDLINKRYSRLRSSFFSVIWDSITWPLTLSASLVLNGLRKDYEAEKK